MTNILQTESLVNNLFLTEGWKPEIRCQRGRVLARIVFRLQPTDSSLCPHVGGAERGSEWALDS